MSWSWIMIIQLDTLLQLPPTFYYLNLLFHFPFTHSPSIMDFSQLSTLLFLTFLAAVSAARDLPGDYLRLPSQTSRFFRQPQNDDNEKGTRWAILLAGSNGYWNYRHQVYVPQALSALVVITFKWDSLSLIKLVIILEFVLCFC